MYSHFNSEITWLIYDFLLLLYRPTGYRFTSFHVFCVIFLLVMSCSYLHAYYGQPAAMALAFRQPSIDISAMCLLFVGSVVVNEILLLLD